MTTAILLVIAFAFVGLASRQVGTFAAGIRLPLITGYLVAGAIVGPFFLGWISREAVLTLRPVDQLSLAFIAFAAGSELYLKELRSQFKAIATITSGLVLSTFTLGTIAVLLLASHVPFLARMSLESRIGVALMAAAILVARSPSSAIAIINELRARGPFTKTSLGVTVVMDAVVILLFAVSVSIAHSLCAAVDFNVTLILNVGLDILLSIVAGYLVGRLLETIALLELRPILRTVFVLGVGLGVYFSAELSKELTKLHLGNKISFEPLLTCMIAGVVVANVGRGRAEFEALLRGVAPLIYIAFFTLVGASLALDALVRLWPIALALFAVRLLGIVMGSFSGSSLAGDPKQRRRVAWMAYVTQAGVGLGLAKEVAAEFPRFGTEFAAMIIAIIVVNQVVGPPLFKFAIRHLGESHVAATAEPDEVRDAVILGIDDQSLAVARQLMQHNWKVIIADPDPKHVERLANAEVDERVIDDVDEKSMEKLVTKATDAVVAMLGSDEMNYRACEIAYEKYGIPRLVVRLNDLSWSDRFAELGASVVEPASAMVNLLDQFVRAPATAALLLHRDPDHEIVQITLSDPDINGLPLRDLRLPTDVRVLEIIRDGQSMVPYGMTELRLNDEVTFVGHKDRLEEVTARWGY